MSKEIDLKGKRFGKLLVIEKTERPQYRKVKDSVYWLCKCDCENYKVASSKSLQSGCAKSCGCLTKNKRDIREKEMIGKKFGRLTVMNFIKVDKNGSYVWGCDCDCGGYKETTTNMLSVGDVKSCGCLQIEAVSSNIKKAQDVAQKINCKGNRTHIHRIFCAYRSGAKTRNIEFELSEDELEKIIFQPCFYCGEEHSNTCNNTNTGDKLLYNGIDRIDNSVGYLPENCVSCCKMCNIAKRDHSVDEFIEWIIRVSKNLKEKELII